MHSFTCSNIYWVFAGYMKPEKSKARQDTAGRDPARVSLKTPIKTATTFWEKKNTHNGYLTNPTTPSGA